MGGQVEHIFTTAGAGQLMTRLDAAVALAGKGLEGDRYANGIGYYSQRVLPGGGRELTLIEAEILDWLGTEHGISFEPHECRRNVVTRGIQLETLIGKQFRIGDVVCEGVRICEPCTYIEGLTGKLVNEPLVHRGGLRANILQGGTLRVGDRVESEG